MRKDIGFIDNRKSVFLCSHCRHLPSLLPSLSTDAGRYRKLEVLESLRDYLRITRGTRRPLGDSFISTSWRAGVRE